MHKGYSNSPFGQIHWVQHSAHDASTKPDLYCLHPAPFSGGAYDWLAPHLANERRVIAPDYPGHGGSDEFKPDPSIFDYAQAMLAVIDELSKAPVDLMGFHTGCLVATELTVIAPEKVRRIAIVDAPAFDAETRAKYLPATAKPLELTDDIHCLDAAWDMGMTKRIESQGLDRSFEMFVEQLRHGRNMNAAFHAAFTYDVEAQLPKIDKPCLVMATQSGLLDATRRAADLIPSAHLIERLDIKRSVLDEAAEATASEITNFLGKTD